MIFYSIQYMPIPEHTDPRHDRDDDHQDQLDERGLPCSADYWDTYAGSIYEQILDEITRDCEMC